MLKLKPAMSRIMLTSNPSTRGLPPNARRGRSSSSRGVTSVDGAGKTQSRHWKILNAASQLAKSMSQMSRRLRLPVICSRFHRVDTVDLFLDFPPHHLHQFADLPRIDLPGV